VRRLFSTFARGWPGAGLLVMRLAGGTALITWAAGLLPAVSAVVVAAAVLAAVAGLLLIAGLWTPVAGAVVAVIGVWFALSSTNNPLAGVLFAAIGAGLALIGPGAWSVDARLFGWKRVDVRDRTT
jgi:uncharacterized membrane protein YphA (DoxX/SURF4 family)